MRMEVALAPPFPLSLLLWLPAHFFAFTFFTFSVQCCYHLEYLRRFKMATVRCERAATQN